MRQVNNILQGLSYKQLVFVVDKFVNILSHFLLTQGSRGVCLGIWTGNKLPMPWNLKEHISFENSNFHSVQKIY